VTLGQTILYQIGCILSVFIIFYISVFGILVKVISVHLETIRTMKLSHCMHMCQD